MLSLEQALQQWGAYLHANGTIVKDDGDAFIHKSADSQVVRIDGCFTAYELEALVVLMRATTRTPLSA